MDRGEIRFEGAGDVLGDCFISGNEGGYIRMPHLGSSSVYLALHRKGVSSYPFPRRFHVRPHLFTQKVVPAP